MPPYWSIIRKSLRDSSDGLLVLAHGFTVIVHRFQPTVHRSECYMTVCDSHKPFKKF